MNSKSKIFIFGGAGLLLIGLVVLLLVNNGGSDTQTGETGTQETAASSYVEWTDEEDFNGRADKQRWLFFYASWCPKCRTLDENIKDNLGKIPEDVVIFKVDYDKEDDLKRKYGVTVQTTVVSVDSDGEEIDSFTGGSSETLAVLVEKFYIVPTQSDDSSESADEDESGDSNTDTSGQSNDSTDTSNQDAGSDAPNQTVSHQNDGSTDSNQNSGSDQVTTNSSSRYIDWTNEANFNQHSSKKRWLFFYASWCPDCRDLDENIKDNVGNIPEDIVIFKVDYTKEDALKSKYGVTVQTTIVSVDSTGKKIESILGGSSGTLNNLIQALD